MTVEHTVASDDDASDVDLDPDETADDRSDTDPSPAQARTRRRADRTGVADRPRENRSPAAQRAIDRRRKRATQRSTATITTRARVERSFWGTLTRSPGDLLRRVPFVVLIIGILSVGLGLTLWLSTTAAQDSYQLSVARADNQDLMDRRDALKKTFELGDSAPKLSDEAVKLGMIPAKDVPRYVIGDDGKGRVVGEITAATGTPPPSMDSDTPRNTVVPQPGTVTDGSSGQIPTSVTGRGQDLSAGAADAGGPIAANVLPQSPAAAPAPAVVPGSSGTRAPAGQQAR